MSHIVGRPFCPTCHRRHWEIVATEAAARHCHMATRRFRAALKAGDGPQVWAHDVYATPRFHVSELDRWLSESRSTAS